MTDVPDGKTTSKREEIQTGDFNAGGSETLTPLQKSNLGLLLLQTFIETVSRIDDERAALNVALECICQSLGWDVAELWRRKPDGSSLECDPLWYKTHEDVDVFRKARMSLTFASGIGLAGRTWMSKEPHWVSNAGSDPGLTEADLGQYSDPVTGVGIPVQVDAQVDIVLVFFAFRIRPLHQGDLWLISTIATLLGWVIQKFRAVDKMAESIERFEAAIQGSDDGVWDAKLMPGQPWNVPQLPIYFSPRCKELLGYAEHELPNDLDSWISRIHEEDRERVTQAVRDHLERRVPFQVEYRIAHKSGEYRWFSTRGQAIWNDLGQPLRIAGAVRDITEQRKAEETLRLRDRAMAASTCGIVIVDVLRPGNPIVYVNPSYERIFGYTAAEALGRNPRFLLSHDLHQPALAAIREAIRLGQPHRAVLRNYHKEGRLVWNELILAPVHDENRRLTHYVGIQNDITDHIRSHEELLMRERLYRSLTENVHSLIVLVDREGVLRYASPSCERLTGYPPEEFLNKSLFDFIDPNDVPEVREAFAQIVEAEGASGIKEFRLRDKSGEWHVLEAVGQNLLNDPAVLGIVINARDVTERKQMERMFSQAEKMAAVGQLAAGIAHELNNPLHAILGFAHSLSEEMGDGGTFSAPLKLIGQEASRCQKLVQNLLTFSRQRANGMVLEDPIEIWNDIIPLIESQAKVNNVVVEKDLQLNLPFIKGDRSQIQQVLMNLCTNAIDAMPDGGRLKIGAALKRRPFDGTFNIVLYVADTGVGIEPKIKERIFEPFFTTKKAGAGTGLGLSLVYEIVQRHNGQITVASEVGKGSLFEVTLPPGKGTPDTKAKTPTD